MCTGKFINCKEKFYPKSCWNLRKLNFHTLLVCTQLQTMKVFLLLIVTQTFLWYKMQFNCKNLITNENDFNQFSSPHSDSWNLIQYIIWTLLISLIKLEMPFRSKWKCLNSFFRQASINSFRHTSPQFYFSPRICLFCSTWDLYVCGEDRAECDGYEEKRK